MGPVRGVLLDLDGTVYTGDGLIPGARETIRYLRDAGLPHLFTTNTSRKSRREVRESLGALGLEVGIEELFTAPMAAARWLEAEGMRRVHLLLAESAKEEFSAFELTSESPDAVLVGDLGRAFSYDRLDAAFRALLSGAALVAVHRNRYWTPDGRPHLDAGPFVAALEYATKREATLVGKPSAAFFHAAAGILGVDVSDVAVVGDDAESDIEGGRRAGMRTIQVRTGKHAAGLEAGLAGEVDADASIASIADLPDCLAG
ncbi:MAG: TIGR01458 family HAD-type hydrolase [Gemmatimonadota bacterium]